MTTAILVAALRSAIISEEYLTCPVPEGQRLESPGDKVEVGGLGRDCWLFEKEVDGEQLKDPPSGGKVRADPAHSRETPDSANCLCRRGRRRHHNSDR